MGSLYKNRIRNALLIAGSTASGKSSLALKIAAFYGGAILNSDAIQMYDDLQILTSRPEGDTLKETPHFFYGHISPCKAYSVGLWRQDVIDFFQADRIAEFRPIFVGGTGLYFRALTQGLSLMPDIPEDVRLYWRDRFFHEGALCLHRVLNEKDPLAAASLHPSDGQRIVRALEVFEVSGRSIFLWQKTRCEPLIDISSARMIVLEPNRDKLYADIHHRVRTMVEQGVIDEVRRFLDQKLASSLPSMKAIGLDQFSAFLKGMISLEEAIQRVTTATRQYAKRQLTWFRHQLEPEWIFLDPEENSWKDFF